MKTAFIVILVTLAVISIICCGLLATIGLVLRFIAWPIKALSELCLASAEFFLPGD